MQIKIEKSTLCGVRSFSFEIFGKGVKLNIYGEKGGNVYDFFFYII